MSLHTLHINKGNARNYIPDPLDPRHPNNPNTPMNPDDPKNPGHPDKPGHPDDSIDPTDEIREPEQPKRKYKFDAANRDPRFYEELMQLMDFGQNELYTRY